MSRTSYGKRNDGVYAQLTKPGEIYLFVTWAENWPNDYAEYGDRTLSVDEAKALADALNEMVAQTKPSVVDQFKDFSIGQTFTTDVDEYGESGHWVKISANQAAYVNLSGVSVGDPVGNFTDENWTAWYKKLYEH